MSQRKSGLGRGFSSLIPTDVLDESFDPTSERDSQVSDLRHLKLADIEPNIDQPRTDFEQQALVELSESIKTYGILQPIVVTRKGDKYEIVAGERRWRAAKLAGLEKVPALVRTADGQKTLEMALIENLQREDLNLIEMATAYNKLRSQFNMTYEEIALIVLNKSPSVVTGVARLINLPDDAKQALIDGKIMEGHARTILSLKGHPEMQTELLNLIIKEEWTIRKAEQFIQGWKRGENQEDKQKTAVTYTKSETPLTQTMSKKLQLPVTFKRMAKGGQIVIRYHDDAELERLEKLF